MKNRKAQSIWIAAAAGIALIAPVAADAEAPSHFAPNEAGVVYHTANTGPIKSQAQVAADLKAASATPEGASMLHWGAMSTPEVGNPKSRAGAVAELEAAQKQSNWDVASRLGAPLQAPPGHASNARAQAQP